MSLRSKFSARHVVWLGLLLIVAGAAACSSSRAVQEDVITVEGMVTARGHEPFVRYVLETPQSTFYVLRLPDEMLRDLRTPARMRITGRVYADDWEGRSLAHLDVREAARID